MTVVARPAHNHELREVLVKGVVARLLTIPHCKVSLTAVRWATYPHSDRVDLLLIEVKENQWREHGWASYPDDNSFETSRCALGLPQTAAIYLEWLRGIVRSMNGEPYNAGYLWLEYWFDMLLLPEGWQERSEEMNSSWAGLDRRAGGLAMDFGALARSSMTPCADGVVTDPRRPT